MNPLQVLVCGTNYGRIYLEAIGCEGEGYCLAGILARGSVRSKQMASKYGVPLFCSVKDLPSGVDLACMAVGSSGSDLGISLLERGIHVLCEHPQKSAFLESALAAADSRGLCFHINGHFAELQAARSFVSQCRRHGAGAPPSFIHVTATDRSLYAALDLLRRIPVSLEPMEFHGCSRIPPFTTTQGHLMGVPSSFHIQCYGDCHPYADGSQSYLVDHRVALGFPSGIVTMLSMNGPVVWNANLNYAIPPAQPLFTVVHEDHARTMALLHQQRVAANLNSLAELAKNMRGGPKPREQTPDYLLEVSRAWETLGGFLSQ